MITHLLTTEQSAENKAKKKAIHNITIKYINSILKLRKLFPFSVGKRNCKVCNTKTIQGVAPSKN